MNKGHDLLHKLLLSNYNDFELGIKEDLKELEGKRKTIHDGNRAFLESKIDKQNQYLKKIREQELTLREIFNYLER